MEEGRKFSGPLVESGLSAAKRVVREGTQASPKTSPADFLTPRKGREGGAITPELSHGRWVGVVELDVAATGPRAAQRVIRIEFGRIEDVDGDDAGCRQPDDGLIVDARFACVSGEHDPIDVTVLVRPGCAANAAGTDRLAAGVGTRVHLQVRRDAGPVNVQARAMVDVLQMPPGRRAVLASAPDAEVCLGAAIADDEAAAGQEVALPSARGAAGQHQRERRDSKRIMCPNSTHCYLRSHCDDSVIAHKGLSPQ